MKKEVRATVEEAIEDIKNGKMIILVDDEDRENEGDLMIAADHVTPEAINFMAKHGRGLICLSLTNKRCDELNLPLMVDEKGNSAKFGTAFTVSIEAKEGVTTGISAFDRAHTIKVASDPEKSADDIARPGHVFPLRAKDGGVLVRAGQTEGSMDLTKLAGLTPAAVICEVMNDDGSMARMPQLEEFAQEHGLKILTIADLISYRVEKENIIEKIADASLPTVFGDFKIEGFENKIDNQEAIALVKGDISGEEPVLVRVHSQCLTGDVFGSLRCDCRDQLHCSMDMIEKEGKGVLLYMFQEGRGIGLLNKIKAYKLQEEGMDTVDANLHLGFKDDLRDYGFGAQILRNLGLKKLRLITNNPKKIRCLSGYGLEVVERVPTVCHIRPENEKYLKAKKEKMGHVFQIKD
ncbi:MULTISPECIES: bifunctional 3,4-dihydroxy-2-butanone-4-phosphate synthase/GTP cyclohydrolase II [Flexistipes]|uniref:Riboflavin biosynthesis protein RibBA n=2 Tax=Flexistipes sinusarabici TaxID=2352 RepID=F8E5S6_FLESM|nr:MULTISPECIES: bifunctional 3,4-dihydroxy-2-butanone-4-phosphate synthase/GTP cyclohydrolase II [Flexistipes]AEI14707.1 GTP cyclohydrolase-2 [Flexistipes sinusarabici DSM 4947]MEC9492645.1 bifunctional 3,4-dihydroxy-2-butanone-4-phosphate synthase/GTP cyclohydrolase II [Flexistipes sp.]HCW94152.1 bifunctional 3,4-dihydroxy-2-butanone-4-phosphate synthase/GTP cyclohydrolase II [Flexistipes sinusarabici]